MAANPNPRLGGNRAHTETTAPDQVKKKQQNRAPAFCLGELPDHRETFCGPTEFTDSAHRMCDFTPIRSDQPEFLE
jgi:hypothetical protein